MENQMVFKWEYVLTIPLYTLIQALQNLLEGKPNVLAMSTPLTVCQPAIETIDPKIQSALSNYQMDWDHIILRETSSCVDLAQEPPNIPYFYKRCLTGKSKGKDGVNTFKKPTKPFELALVIDPDQWEEVMLHLSQQEVVLPQFSDATIHLCCEISRWIWMSHSRLRVHYR
jgi:hypothetical protein